MGSCNSSNRTSAAIAESFKQPLFEKQPATKRSLIRKSKLSKTVSFLDSLSNKKKPAASSQFKQQQQNSNDHSSTSPKQAIFNNITNTQNLNNNKINCNHLPKIELDSSKYYCYNNKNTTSYNRNNNTVLTSEIEEYDNAVLDYFINKKLKEADDYDDENIIYADEVSYPFPSVNLNENTNTTTTSTTTTTATTIKTNINTNNNNHKNNYNTNNISDSTAIAKSTNINKISLEINQPLINFASLISNRLECSSTASFIHLNAFTDMITQPQLQQQRTDNNNSLTSNNITTNSSFETSSSLSFLLGQPTKLMNHSSNKQNRFGFKPSSALPMPAATVTTNANSNANTNTTGVKMSSTKSTAGDSLANISSSMPNSASNQMLKDSSNQQHQRNKSPFRSFLPRPPASNIKSQSSIPTSLSNSASIAASVSSSNSTQPNMTRTISTSGVSSSTSKHNQSSSLSSLSSTASSCLSNNLITAITTTSQNDEKKSSKSSPKKQSPNKASNKTHIVNTLSSSKLQANQTVNSNGNSNTSSSSNSTNSKRRLFSPYTLNIPTAASTTVNTNAISINLNQMYSNDFNNNLSKIGQPSSSKQSNIKPPTVLTNTNGNQFKIYSHLNSKKFTSHQASAAGKASKMPVKSIGKLNQSSEPSSSHQKLDELINYSNHSPVKKVDLMANVGSGSGLLKREDSAYCSSTSSTVSSQETEINKFPTKKSTHETVSSGASTDPHATTKSGHHNPHHHHTLILVDSNNNNNEETDSEFNHDEDYSEDNLDQLKQTIMNLDLKSSSNMLHLDQISEMNFDTRAEKNDSPSTTISSVNNHTLGKIRSNRNSSSIRDSIGELSQLMNMSISVSNNHSASPSLNDESSSTNSSTTPKSSISSSKLRRTSAASIGNTTNQSNVQQLQHQQQQQQQTQPMFKPPSNLPPAENSEVIQIDIDTFRLLMQDMQNTKIILYKLANVLREPQVNNNLNNSDCSLVSSDDMKPPDDLQSLMASNPLISSFYNYQSLNQNFSDKIDQSTQTE